MIKVSVILPVYGYSQYISEAIESILNQSLEDMELIVIEDPKNGKFENEAIIDKYKNTRQIMRYVKNEYRQGLVNSLNKGLSIAEADYIARQDADDLSLPDRLLVQYDFLRDGNCAVVGGNMVIIDENGETKGYRRYPEVVTGRSMLLRNLVAHPTVMFNKTVILSLGSYDSEMLHVEDYDLWLRVLDRGYKIHNLPTYLIKYRYHKEAVKYKAFKKSVLNGIRLQTKAIRTYRNIGYNVLFPMYFLAEILLLILPIRLGYFLFKKLSVRGR